MFPDDQNIQRSICFKTSDQNIQTPSQTIGWDFEVFRGNQKLSAVFEKLSDLFLLSHVAELYVFPNQTQFFFGRTFIFRIHFLCLCE